LLESIKSIFRKLTGFDRNLKLRMDRFSSYITKRVTEQWAEATGTLAANQASSLTFLPDENAPPQALENVTTLAQRLLSAREIVGYRTQPRRGVER
jgi:hypothetical protein